MMIRRSSRLTDSQIPRHALSKGDEGVSKQGRSELKALLPCPEQTLDKDPWDGAEVPDVSEWKGLPRTDVAVVGAGLGGINAARRLQEEGAEVSLYERTDHLGGRIRSTKIENEAPVEMGAMRYIPSLHPKMKALVEEELKIPTENFVVSDPDSLRYFRGVRMTSEEVAQHPEKRPYFLRPQEKDKSMSELLSMAIEAVVPGFESLSQEEWERVKREQTVPIQTVHGGVENVPLSQLGIRNVLSHTLSEEAVQLVTDSIGYEIFMKNWNAGEALDDLAASFKPNTIYKSVPNGMQTVPQTMALQFEGAGGDIKTNHTLRRVEYDPNAGFLLQFSDMQGKSSFYGADRVVWDCLRSLSRISWSKVQISRVRNLSTTWKKWKLSP